VSGGGSRGRRANEKKCRETVALWWAELEGTSEKERTGYGKHASVCTRTGGAEGLRGSREREPKKTEYENLITTDAPPKRMTEKNG